jgi:hypothetical protein
MMEVVVEKKQADRRNMTLTEMEELVRSIGANAYLRIGASTRTGPDGRHMYTVTIMQNNPGAKTPWRTLGEGCAVSIQDGFGLAMKKAAPKGPHRPKV